MPSLTPRDRLSLCRFIFADGRTCRTPRISTNPNFCFYHAQLEAQSQASAKLAEDLSRLFSGNSVTANDLSAALCRLIPAVLQGHIKPRAARTVAYMIQTLLQTIRISQPEHTQASGANAWPDAASSSANASNHDDTPRNAIRETQPAPPAPRQPKSDQPRTSQNTGEPQTSTLPAHRQPETVASALAAARSLFPSRPDSQAPTDQASTSHP
jgi:hypothetical protein